MGEQLINRRETIKYLGLLTATVAGREFLAEWLAPMSATFADSRPETMGGMHHGIPQDPDQGKPYSPRFFSLDEYAVVDILAEMIIPADNKPGAHDAQVARYIDFVVLSAAEFSPALQRQWTEGLEWLESASQKQWKKSFRDLAATEREQLMTDMSLPERDTSVGKDHPGFKFYELVKGMTVEGFYTSRIGLIEVLNYQGLNYLAEFPGCTHPEHQR